MRHYVLILSLVACLMSPTVSAAEEQPPPKPPTASVYAGPCLSPALNGPVGLDDKDQAAFAAGLLAAAAPKLIGAGLDWVDAKLAALGADEITTISAARTSEANYNTRYCVQFARWATDGPNLSDLSKASSGGAWTWPTQDKVRVPLDKPLDLFAEFWVRTSDSGKAIALTPTLLYYPKQLASGRNGRDPSALVLSVRLEPSGGSATAVSWAPPRQKLQPDLQVMIPARVNGASWVRQRLGDLQRICEVACETASPWAANPWAGGKAPKAGAGGLAVGVGPGTDAIEQAVNINVDFTEIRPGSKFFKALAEAFATAKPDIQSQIEQVVIADARDKAEAQATTATATALVAFAGKMSEAEEAHDKYCAAKGKPTGVLLGLSADLGAKQRLANVAAAAAELSVPFPTPAAASGTFNTSLCP